MKLRPFTGRFSTAVELTTELTCVRVVSRTGAVAADRDRVGERGDAELETKRAGLADLDAEVLLAPRRKPLQRRRHLVRAHLQTGRGEAPLGIGDELTLHTGCRVRHGDGHAGQHRAGLIDDGALDVARGALRVRRLARGAAAGAQRRRRRRDGSNVSLTT